MSKVDTSITNFLDYINSPSFNLLDNGQSTNDVGSSSSINSGNNTLPKVNININKSSKKEGKNNNKKNKTSKKSKSKKVKKPRSSFLKENLLNPYELNLKSSDEIIGELNHYNEGFDLNIGQTICDDSRPSIGEEAQSYFIMRHSFVYPGPMMTMMQAMGGGGGYGYRVSAEAIHRDKYILVATYQANTIEGMMEYNWNKNIKSHCTFIAGFESQKQKQLAAMMMGGMGQQGPRFPTGIMYTDFRYNTFASRLNIDLMSNQLSLSFNKKLTNNLSIGTKFVTSYEARRSLIEFGFKYQYYNNLFKNNNLLTNKDNIKKNKLKNKDNNNSSSSNVGGGVKKAGRNTIEGSFNTHSNFIECKYSHNISENCALTSTLKWKLGTYDQMLTAFGYKYQFGRHMMAGKTITGEIASDGNFRQMITFPLLQNMMCKFYAEINHFISPQQMQQGQFPHKFGFQLNVHL